MAQEKEGPQSDPTTLQVSMIDLSKVETRRKNMLLPCLTIDWNTYVAETSALAVPVVGLAALEAGLAHNKPVAFEVGAIAGKPSSVGLFPRKERSDQYLKASWVSSGTRCKFDFQKLLAVYSFEIPRGTTAVIPITRGSYPLHGPCVEVHFGQAEFQVIEQGKRKNSREQAATAQDPAKPGQQP